MDGAATVAVRGSHRVITRLLQIARWPVPRWQLVTFCEALMAQPAWREKIVQVVGHAGDVAFLHPHVIHSASANVASDVRVHSKRSVARCRERSPRPLDLREGLAIRHEGASFGMRRALRPIMIHPNQIRPDAPVVCSKNGQFAVVDHVEGTDTIKLKKDASGQHHYIPMNWVTSVDDKVHVDRPGDQAKREWSTQPQTATA